MSACSRAVLALHVSACSRAVLASHVSACSRDVQASHVSACSRDVLASHVSACSCDVLASHVSACSRDVLASHVSACSRDVLASHVSACSHDVLASHVSACSHDVLASHVSCACPMPHAQLMQAAHLKAAQEGERLVRSHRPTLKRLPFLIRGGWRRSSQLCAITGRTCTDPPALHAHRRVVPGSVPGSCTGGAIVRGHCDAPRARHGEPRW